MANLRAPRVITGLPTTPAARPEQYSLGFDVGVDATGRLRMSHSGASALGVGTNFSLSPAAGVGIVVLTNAAPVGVAEAISAEFMDRALIGHTTRNWYAAYHAVSPGSPAPGTRSATRRPAIPNPRSATAYVGTYFNDFYGTLEVVERDGALVMQLGPAPEEFGVAALDRQHVRVPHPG